MSLTCNRLNITGPLNERTPVIVIQEVALAHRIRYQPERASDPNYIRAVVKTIYSPQYPVTRIEKPFTQEHIPQLIRYLGAVDLEGRGEGSRCQEWTVQELDAICTYWDQLLNQITQEPNTPINIENIGPVTRNCPHSLNACFLYRICRVHNLSMHPEVTLEGLTIMAKLLFEPINISIELINSMLVRGTEGRKNEILPLLALLPNSYLSPRIPPLSLSVLESEPPSYDSLFALLEDRHFTSMALSQNGQVRRGYMPKNDIEATALAAHTFGINLFYSRNHLKEYRIIRNSELSRYQPVDSAMAEIYRKNKDLIQLRIFEPRMPEAFYNSSTLLTAAEYEGYSMENVHHDSPYELLQLAYLSETFHLGWFPNIQNHHTPFSEEDLESLDPNTLICFGCRADHLMALELSELTSMFRGNGNFRNCIPGFRGHFPDISIRKLKLICQNLGTPQSLECIREIDAIDSLISTASVTLNTFAKRYFELSESEQRKILVMLNNLLELSMYMRGWDGRSIETYPIMKAPVDNQNLVDIRVTEAVNKFEISMEQSPMTSLIKSLPLIKFEGGRFLVSNDAVNGRTLGDRVAMMKRGENESNINSCIRLTSNWLAASCYRYFQVLKLQVPFEIETLRWIT